MIKFVVGCIAVFLLAAAFIVVTQAQDMAALFEAFRAVPLMQKLAWFLVVLIPLVLIPAALWLCDTLIRQRKIADALELRLGGVRQGVQSLAVTQIDADAAIHHLARTDPEDAIGAVTQRLAEAEAVLRTQQGRNEIGDLQSRVEALRVKQQGLRDRLVPALEKRRSIEQFFAELDSRERDIDRTLAEIASGDDAVAIEVRLNKLMEFVRHSHARCDEIERSSKSLASLTQDYSELGERLVPYAAPGDGIAQRIKELTTVRDRLAADIDALLKTPQGGLAARVQSFVDDKGKLDDGLAGMELHFSKLSTLREGVAGLSARFDRALDRLGLADAADPDSRIAALSEFIVTTQAEFDAIERNMGVFGEMRAQLGALQARLAPFEAEHGGVTDLVAQVKDIRDRLIARIARIEADEDGDLDGRVNTLSKAKQELEKRVSNVTEQFSKLATIRNDIAGLFDRLSNAAERSSN